VEETPEVQVSSPAAQSPALSAGEKPDLKLQGTMVTHKGPAAMVSGQMLYVGDTIGSWEIIEVGDGYIKVKGWAKRIYIK